MNGKAVGQRAVGKAPKRRAHGPDRGKLPNKILVEAKSIDHMVIERRRKVGNQIPEGQKATDEPERLRLQAFGDLMSYCPRMQAGKGSLWLFDESQVAMMTPTGPPIMMSAAVRMAASGKSE